MLKSISKKLNFINFLDENYPNRKKQYFLIYTILFAAVSSLVFSWYYIDGRTFIGGDGWSQHYKALIYYARFLRSVIKSLIIDHQLIIPAWDFSIGEGSDIFQTLHYYVIGDPFALLSMFIPTKFMYLYYDAMILLRLYLAGIAFSCLCFYTGLKNYHAVLAGATAYVFCFYGLLNATLHPFFLNPMLYLPLLILGVEMILKENKPYLFIIAVFFSAISNFYFFYILAALTAVYVLAKLLTAVNKNLYNSIITIIRIAAFSILGVLMAAVILLPMLHVLLNSPRFSTGSVFRFFYPLSYYMQLPGQFLSQTGLPEDWICMGYAAPILPAVFLLFYKKRQAGFLKTLFVIGFVFILFPVFGRILNGFSYECNRWSFGFALLNAYILTYMWPYLMELTKKEGAFLFACTLIYAALCLALEPSRSTRVFVSLSLCFVFLILICPCTDLCHSLLDKRQQLVLLLIIISIVCAGFWQNADNRQWTANRKEASQISRELTTNETIAVKRYAESDGKDDFYRYSGIGLTSNANLLSGLSSTQFYWSLSNPYVAEFRHDMGISDVALHSYSGYGASASLNSLAAVHYYLIPANSNAPVPYGFTDIGITDINEDETSEVVEKLKKELGLPELSEEQVQLIYGSTISAYRIFRNDYALPLTYRYHSVMSQDRWHQLSAVQKQEVLLQSVVLDGYQGSLPEQNITTSSTELKYTLTYDPGKISQLDNCFVVTSPGASITLDFEGIPESETYFSIDGLSFDGTPSYNLYFGDTADDPLNLYNQTNWDLLSAQEKKNLKKDKRFWTEPTPEIKVTSSADIDQNITCYTENNHYYYNRHDFTANLGYTEKPVSSIRVSFSEIGKYYFDSLHVTCLPMRDYAQKISELSETCLKNTVIDTNVVTGSISMDTPGILCFAIPYSDGWEAYVDDQKVRVYRANDMYMGLDLTAGSHSIKLVYHTPYQKPGCWISLLGFLIFGIMILKARLRAK